MESLGPNAICLLPESFRTKLSSQGKYEDMKIGYQVSECYSLHLLFIELLLAILGQGILG